MAENNVIISAEEEAKLLKPIDEYVGKIQAQIDALRVEGSDKVNSLKNQIAIAKENKNLTKEQQNKIIEESKKQLEKAKATEDANKEQITKLIADAEGYLSKHYSSEYYDIVVKSCEAEKKAENSSFEKTKTQLQEEHKKALGSLKDAEEIKAEKYTYKNKLYDAQMAHESRLQEIKDRKHDAFMHKFHLIDLLRMSKYTFAQKQAQKIENYKYRILFFEYGIGMYPVKIVLEQGIADEIFEKENANYIIEYETKNELENVIINILKTKKVIKVMQELIYATKRFERLDKKELKLVDKSSDENDE